jgi:hypothetical protein
MGKLCLLIFCLLLTFCKRDRETNVFYKEGYVVGFDQCSYQHNYNLGFAIITKDLSDTLMCYNFPDGIFRFPEAYFQNYINSGFFPSSARYEFKIKFSYTVATKEELIFNLCTTDINASDFTKSIQVILLSVEKI